MPTSLGLLATVSADTARLRSAACPERGSGLPTEIYDEVGLASTDDPIAHARTRCIVGHRFFMPLENLSQVRPISAGLSEVIRVGPGPARRTDTSPI
jgi:hypothetical protein